MGGERVDAGHIGPWVLLTVTRGGTVSVASPFNTREAAEDAKSLVMRGMTVAEAAAADKARKESITKWMTENPGKAHVEYSSGRTLTDSTIMRAFVFADPPRAT